MKMGGLYKAGQVHLLTYILQHLVTLIDDEMADGFQVECPLLCQLQS